MDSQAIHIYSCLLYTVYAWLCYIIIICLLIYQVIRFLGDCCVTGGSQEGVIQATGTSLMESHSISLAHLRCMYLLGQRVVGMVVLVSYHEVLHTYQPPCLHQHTLPPGTQPVPVHSQLPSNTANHAMMTTRLLLELTRRGGGEGVS